MVNNFNRRRSGGTQKFHRFHHCRGEIEGLELRVALTGESQNACHQVLCAQPRLPDLRQAVLDFEVVFRRLPRDFAEPEDSGEDIVEIVRNATGQRAERVEFLCLQQLRFQPPATLLLSQPLSDVFVQGEIVFDNTVRAADRRQYDPHPDRAAVFGSMGQLPTPRFSRGQRLGDFFFKFNAQWLRQKVADIPPLQLRPVVAIDSTKMRIGEYDRAVGRGQSDAVGTLLNRLRQAPNFLNPVF